MSAMVFFNIGWMNAYRGRVDTDSISGGGAWVAEHGTGHEIYNFAAYRNNYYGAVQPPGGEEIHIERLGAQHTDEYLDHVTVAWVAKDPAGGLRLIGWYGDARVYRHWQASPPGASRGVRSAREQASYLAVAPVTDSVLLHRDERTLSIPRGRRGAMGQANVWFAESELGRQTILDVRSFIDAHSERQQQLQTHAPSRSGPPRAINPARKAQVEQAAIETVRAYFGRQGFQLRDVQEDNLGWDLEASRDGETLFIEVKGLSGPVSIADLTPNEYAQMRIRWKTYRLCIVSNALSSQNRRLQCFSAIEKGTWVNQDDGQLQIEERIGARVRLVNPAE